MRLYLNHKIVSLILNIFIIAMINICTVITIMFVFFPDLSFSAQIHDKIVLMYQVQKNVTDYELALLKNKGVNFIQSFSLITWSDPEIRDYLDRAHKHGLKVIVSLCGFLKQDRSKAFKETEISLSDFKKSVDNFIRKWKYHPAIALWHTIDEPKEVYKRVSKKDQEEIYNFVKRCDPGRLIMISQNLTNQKEYDEYFSEQAFDILDIHAYVNPEISKVQSDLINLFRINRRKRYPLIITFRAFNGSGWQDLREDSLQKQYDYFIIQANLTMNYGFYGWQLDARHGNYGISQVEYIKKQFINLSTR